MSMRWDLTMCFSRKEPRTWQLLFYFTIAIFNQVAIISVWEEDITFEEEL